VTSIFAFIFVLGVLVFVHELGHFLAARRIGVRVLTFSLGFGPKLLSFKRGDTEYCISAIPLGGYVKMAGENPDDQRTGAPDEFLSKSKWQRFQVLIMGPIMNLALAWIVMALVLYQGAPMAAYEKMPVVVGKVDETSVAAKAGIKPGDRIISVDGVDIPSWEQFGLAIIPKANRQVSLVLVRDGKPVNVQLTPAAVGKFEIGDIGVGPAIRPQITVVNPGEPASHVGLKDGDTILAVGGERDVTRDRVIELIRGSEGKPLTFEIERDGQPMTFTVTPRKFEEHYRIGAVISPMELRKVEPTLFGALKMSAKQNLEWAQMIFHTLGGLITRETSVKQLMGPVAIADMSGDAAEAGWIQLFGLMAMISLNLGLINLMPIPVLDGGHIAILAIEGLSRRDFSIKVKEKMLLAGFVLLVMLMVTVIYNDLRRVEWFGSLTLWR
jgi:regulator of sigma E protease